MVIDVVERRAFAEELAVEAGNLALSYRERGNIEVRSKGILDWVTEADLATEQLIRRRIGESFPDDNILGEEGGGGSLYEIGSNTWVIDPIDGTTCFVSDLPSWCVSIACLDDRDRAYLGVVHDPTGAETFSALVGHGFAINGIHVSIPSMGITDGLVAVGHPRNASDEPTLTFLRNLFAIGGLFYNSGSAALGLAYVAAGRLVGFFESDLRAWDALAGEVLIRESGRWSTSFMRDRSLTTSKPVLAANRGSASAMWGLATNLMEECSRPDQDTTL